MRVLSKFAVSLTVAVAACFGGFSAVASADPLPSPGASKGRVATLVKPHAKPVKVTAVSITERGSAVVVH